jgi:hypothetical protein
MMEIGLMALCDPAMFERFLAQADTAPQPPIVTPVEAD